MRGLLVLLAVGYGGPAVAATPSASAPVLRFADAAITESSGLAVSSYDDRVVFTHNDSGDTARFFAVDARNGATLATYRVPGAANVDWEDMAAAPDESGRPSLWFADIGDNRGLRSSVSVYRVPEPRVARNGPPAVPTTAPAVRLSLHYPDGPHDAEARSTHAGALSISPRSRCPASRPCTVRRSMPAGTPSSGRSRRCGWASVRRSPAGPSRPPATRWCCGPMPRP